MAAVETPATPKTEKPKFELTISWQHENGQWTEATSERSFDVPDELAEIKVSVVSDDGKTTSDVTRNFKRRVIKNESEAFQLLKSEPLLAVSALNYALDLFARGTIKGPIASEVEGPGKAIKKMAEQLKKSREALGKPITLERALEIVAANMQD